MVGAVGRGAAPKPRGIQGWHIIWAPFARHAHRLSPTEARVSNAAFVERDGRGAASGDGCRNDQDDSFFYESLIEATPPFVETGHPLSDGRRHQCSHPLFSRQNP